MKKLRNRYVTDTQSIPNWGALKPIADHQEFRQRYIFLTEGKPNIRGQMINSTKHRKTIPVYVWEDLVDFAIYAAAIDWDPERHKKCPLRNYAWQRLRWVRLAWWVRNKHTVQLSAPKI